MSPDDFQRARQPHQKEARRADILRVAREMLDENGLNELTLSALARRVGLVKSNLYRYFESREAILLQVMLEDIRELDDELVDELSRLRGPTRIERVASLLASSMAARPRLCLLVSAQGAVLVRNVSVEACLQFQTDSYAEVMRLSAAMEEAVPELTAQQHAEVIQFFGALVAGRWPDADLSEGMRDVLSHPLEKLKGDFEQLLERGALLLLRGAMASKPRDEGST